ncbi:TonB-dependent receptor [Zhongshania marina]|uniref:TonB-dependent receptor n=1 Tax=Zhongshania marina TaxID=2304603 RepID=A0ABX9W3M0_9GAMM|nr:TonB-dependent receptor [Zhongshania marina]
MHKIIYGISISLLASTSVLAAEARRSMIEEVVVTATKRDGSLQDTTIAISAMSAEQLEFRDVSSLSDMQNSVPNLQYGEIGGVPFIAVRGIGFNLPLGIGEPGVAVHVDNVALPRLGSMSTAGMDMRQIEVLRGPQGTVYGRNATGGAANFVSTPPTEEFEGKITLGIGSEGRQNGEGYLSGSFTDNFRGRIFYISDEFDGFGINEFNGDKVGGNKTEGVRAALSWDVTDNLTIDLNAYQRTDEGSNPTASPVNAGGLTTVLGTPFLRPDIGVKGDPNNINDDRTPYTAKETELGILTVSWATEHFDLKSISAKIHHTTDQYYSVDATNYFIIDAIRDEDSDTISQEFNLSGSLFDSRVDWLVGAFYFQDKGNTNFTPILGVDELTGLISTPTGAGLVLDALLEDQNNVAKALFTEVSWRFADDWKFLVGARYSEETKEALQTFYATLDVSSVPPSLLGILNTVVSPIAGAVISDSCERTPAEVSFNSFDPKFELSWQPSDEILVYVQNQRGFKAGGISSTECGQSYVPEEVNSSEIGLKAQFFDNRLTINSAIFHYEYTDYQVLEYNGIGLRVISAPKASGSGAESEIVYAPTDWMNIDVALSYLDAKYDEFMDADGFEDPNFLVPTAEPRDLSGMPLNRAPRYTGNLGLNFFIPFDSSFINESQIRLEAYTTDSIAFTQFSYKDSDRQDGYTLFNAYFGLSMLDNKLSVRTFVKNITNEDYIIGVFTADIIHLTSQIHADPRSYGLQVSYGF